MKTCVSCDRRVEELLHTCPHCGSDGFASGGSADEALAMLDGMQRQAEAARLVDRGAQLIMAGDYDGAETALSQALAVNPMNATAHANMGGLHLRRGLPEQAIPWLEKALEINPRLEGVQEALAGARASLVQAAAPSPASISTVAAPGSAFSPETASMASPGKIAGWLLLPALALVVQPISFLHKIYAVLQRAPAGARIVVNWPSLWFDLILLVMVALVSWAFFRKRACAPPLFMAHVLLMWLAWAIINGFADQYLDEGLIGMTVHLAVLIPYLLFSRRVREVFVGEPENPADRLLAALAGYPTRLFRFLRGQGWLAPVYLVAFLAGMVVFQAVLRSWYLNGNLSETFRLITG